MVVVGGIDSGIIYTRYLHFDVYLRVLILRCHR